MNKKKLDADDDDDKFVLELDTHFMAQKLVILKGSDDDILSRTKKLQNEKYLDSN